MEGLRAYLIISLFFLFSFLKKINLVRFCNDCVTGYKLVTLGESLLVRIFFLTGWSSFGILFYNNLVLIDDN